MLGTMIHITHAISTPVLLWPADSDQADADSDADIIDLAPRRRPDVRQ